jgi:hypothetical protein
MNFCITVLALAALHLSLLTVDAHAAQREQVRFWDGRQQKRSEVALPVEAEVSVAASRVVTEFSYSDGIDCQGNLSWNYSWTEGACVPSYSYHYGKYFCIFNTTCKRVTTFTEKDCKGKDSEGEQVCDVCLNDGVNGLWHKYVNCTTSTPLRLTCSDSACEQNCTSEPEPIGCNSEDHYKQTFVPCGAVVFVEWDSHTTCGKPNENIRARSSFSLNRCDNQARWTCDASP